MKEKLQHTPLALLDPQTVKNEDIVPMSFIGYSPTGLPT